MRAALIQTTTGLDPDDNARSLVAALDQARAAGAGIAFTPEMSGLLDRDRARAASAIVGEAEDRVLCEVRAAAARLGLWVQLGSLALREPAGDGRLANRGFLIDNSGAIRARYDKLHLFDIDLASGESWRESSTYAPGGRVVVAETPWGRLGLSICYDLRFAELYRALSEAGAVMLSVPAAFTVPTGEAHWQVLLRARAIENAAFLFAAAQSGTHADGRATYGHSLAIDPWGRVLLDMGEGVGVGIVDVDLGEVDVVRARIPVLAHRRAFPAAEIAA